MAETVGGVKAESIGGNKAENIGGNKSLLIAKDYSQTITGQKSVKIVKDLKEEVTGQHREEVSKEFMLTAKKVQVTADDEIHLKTGSAEIILKSNGNISIKGSKINIEGSGDVIQEAFAVHQLSRGRQGSKQKCCFSRKTKWHESKRLWPRACLSRGVAKGVTLL